MGCSDGEDFSRNHVSLAPAITLFEVDHRSYPTMFFLVLSMSRYLSTFARKSYYFSRFINWDLSQSFHIKMSIVALFFASLHAIGHLTG
jgi:hypothetical protein